MVRHHQDAAVIGRAQIRAAIDGEHLTRPREALEAEEGSYEIEIIGADGVAVRDFEHGLRHRIARSEEHTSELLSLMRISYAVFCLKKKTRTHRQRVVIVTIER